MNIKKKLSIIIPVYNEAPYLKRCLDSVCCIDSRIEIIVIDDGSTDGSGKICDGYRDLFKIVHHTTNWGVSMTRNHGLALAEGEYVTFLDSDDEMSDFGIWHMLNAVELERPIIQFNHRRYYHKTGKTVTKYVNETGFYNYGDLPKVWCMVWNKIYRLSFLKENKIRFDERIGYGEDEVFNLRCLRAYSLIWCSDQITTIKHFENQDSICHTLNKEQLLRQSDALVRLLREDSSQEFEALVRQVIAEHWNSDIYKKLIGGENDDL